MGKNIIRPDKYLNRPPEGTKTTLGDLFPLPIDNYIIEGVDTIEPADFAEDLCYVDTSLTWEKVLEHADILDRFYSSINEKDDVIGVGLFDRGENIYEYSKMKDPDYNYEYMKVEDPDRLTEGELECSSEDDLDYFLSIRTKNLDYSATNISEVMNLLEMSSDETIYRLRIHLNISNRKFLITGTFEPDISYYTINLVSEG